MKKFTLSGLALVIGSALCHSVKAQESTDSSQEENSAIEKILVTAQKRTQSVQEVPISISAFSGDMLEDMGLAETAQLGEYIPGLEIGNASGEGSQLIVFLRGAGLNDFNTNNAGPIGIYSDEVYISSPALTAFQFFDTQRLEVLKGPQGTLYGRNTTGGAIKFVTNKPTEDFEAKGRLSYGNYDTAEIEAAVSGPLTESVSGRLAFIKSDSDGFVENLQDSSDIGAIDSLAYRGFLSFDLDELQILVNYHGVKLDSQATNYVPLGATKLVPEGQFGDVIDLNTLSPIRTRCSNQETQANQCQNWSGYGAPDDPFTGNYNAVDNIDLDSKGGYIQMDYDFGDFALTSVTAYDEVERFLPEETDGFPGNLLGITYGIESETFSQELRIVGETKSTNWLAGAFYLSEDLNQDQTIDIFRDLRFLTGGLSDVTGLLPIVNAQILNTQSIESYALFGQATYAVSESLNLTAGIRYTKEERDFSNLSRIIGGDVVLPPDFVLYDVPDLKTNSDAVSYRLAIDYQLAPNKLLYGSISRGYKSGGFNGGFLSLNAEEAALQLQPYDPEFLTAYEIGFKSDLLNDRLRFNTAMFLNDFTDSQVFTLVRTDALPVQILDNASDAEVIGLEFDITALLTDSLSVMLSGAFLDSELKNFQSNAGDDFSGNQIARTPDTSISSILRYEHFLGNGAVITAQTSIAYKDDQFFSTENNPVVGQEAFTTVNARLSYESEDGMWKIAAFVTNLTDKAYTNSVVDLVDLGGIYIQTFAPPRQFGVELSVAL